jgi:hypothetical protein
MELDKDGDDVEQLELSSGKTSAVKLAVTHAVIATLWRFRSSSKTASSAFGSRTPFNSSKLLRGSKDVGMKQGVRRKSDECVPGETRSQ